MVAFPTIPMESHQMREHYSRTTAPLRLLATIAVAALTFTSGQSALAAQQKPTRAIALAIENVTLEVEADGTLTRITSGATEPVMARGSEAETETIRRARERVMGQLSRFLANEQGASQAVQQSLARLTPPLGPEAAGRLQAGLGIVARNYRARTLSPPNMSGTKSADGTTVSLSATVTGPFIEAPAANVAPGTVPGSVQGGTPGAVLGGVVGGLSGAPPPPPPSGPTKVGDNVAQPAVIKHVPPVYPPIAQSARVSGAVGLEGMIGAHGKVKNARIIKSIPLLDQAAIDAVKQWEYTPTVLGGVPVP